MPTQTHDSRPFSSPVLLAANTLDRNTYTAHARLELRCRLARRSLCACRMHGAWQEALGAVLAASHAKHGKGKTLKASGNSVFGGIPAAPKAVPLGADRKQFLVEVCGLTCRDNKFFLEDAPGGATAPVAPPPSVSEPGSSAGAPAGRDCSGGPKGVDASGTAAAGAGGGAGRSGAGGGGDGNCKGRLIGFLSKNNEKRPIFQTIKLPGTSQVCRGSL